MYIILQLYESEISAAKLAKRVLKTAFIKFFCKA